MYRLKVGNHVTHWIMKYCLADLSNTNSIDLYISLSTVSATYLKKERNDKFSHKQDTNKYRSLTLSVLMSYIYGAPCKARNFDVVYIVYMDLRLATLKAVSFYLLHNVSTLNQCRKLSCGTVVCKHFVSYQGYPNYRWDLIR
jgi:hypothetical protein